MSSQNILIIEPSTSGLKLLETAKIKGLNVVVFSANKDERIIPLVYKNYIDKLVEIDTNSIENLMSATLEFNSQYHFSAVIPGFELYVAHAARLAKLINVPGVSPETGDMLRNKNLMRNALKDAGVKIPRHTILSSINEIDSVAQLIQFPCVIKPIDQSGSVHVSKVNNKMELLSAYKNMCDDTWTEMAKGVGSIAVVEEYVEGPEFSVEGFVNNKKMRIVSITEKLVKGAPFFVEMGHIVFANTENNIKISIEAYMQQVIAALNLNLGVFHAEIKMTNDGPILIEIAGRLAGDKICDLILHSSGINLYQIMIESHLGNYISIEEVKNSQYSGIRYFSSDLKKYSKIFGLEKIHAMDGFQEFKLLIKPDEKIPPLTNFMARVGYCILTANSYEELRRNLNLAETYLQFI